MMTRSLAHWLLVTVLFGTPAAAQSGQPAEIPADLFSRPTGRDAVGTREYLWIDQKRPETFTTDPDDRRRVLARVWYPAEAAPGAERALYIREPQEFGDSSRYRTLRHVRTNAVTDAPVATSQRRYPVLVYQPGGGTARFVATFQTEQLASHGYVVVSTDHAGFSQTVLFPDGYRFRHDTLRSPAETGTLRDDVLASWGYLDRDVFPTWTADASFILDKLEEIDRTPGQPFYQRLDLTRIGMLGWSFGGATSLQMSKEDPRVKAAVDQDGQLFGDVRETGTGRPVMLMNHGGEDEPPTPEAAPLWRELLATTERWSRTFLERSTSDWYVVTIANTQHGHFSDFTLFYPRKSGELDPRRAHEIITAYTLAFFDKYLLGRDSELLKGPSAAYPEVTLEKKSRAENDRRSESTRP